LRPQWIKRRWIIIFILVFLLVGVGIYFLLPFPQYDPISSGYPLSFHISKENKFEKQGHHQCAAFSTAFILRNFGEEVNGSQTYKEMSYEIPFLGWVLPKGVVAYIKSYGLNPVIFKGTITTLKSRLAQGEPLIVILGEGFRWQHYMTLVGYNSSEKEIYFFDSEREFDENGNLPGNCTFNEEYFLTLWDNGLPIFNHIYIAVQ